MMIRNTKWQYYYSRIDFKQINIWVKDLFNEINCKKSEITNTVPWKTTLKTIHQLSCFLRHPVSIVVFLLFECYLKL